MREQQGYCWAAPGSRTVVLPCIPFGMRGARWPGKLLSLLGLSHCRPLPQPVAL